jgi:uncharacterized protein DUF6228
VASEAVISSSKGSRAVVLSNPEWSGGELDYFTATIRAEGLSATRRIYAYGAATLIGFFEDIAVAWRGWEGEKSWASVEGDLEFAATHDGLGHVSLRARVANLGEGWDWDAWCELILDAGAHLEATLGEIRRFVENGR